MATMTEVERMVFLAEARMAFIAVEWGDRAPLSMPVWYEYEPGGDVLLWAYADSLKSRLVRAARRFSLTSQQVDLPYRYVTVQGPVTTVQPAQREWVEALAVRYLGTERGKAHIADVFEPGSLAIRMRPERWFSGAFLYTGVDESARSGVDGVVASHLWQQSERNSVK